MYRRSTESSLQNPNSRRIVSFTADERSENCMALPWHKVADGKLNWLLDVADSISFVNVSFTLIYNVLHEIISTTLA